VVDGLLIEPDHLQEWGIGDRLLQARLGGADDEASRAAERARDAVSALRELGCDVELVPTRHPVVDIVRFQLLTLALAEARGVDPDRIHRDDPRWARARAAYT